MTQKKEKIFCTIKYVIFVNYTNMYIVLKVTDKTGKSFIATGVFPEFELFSSSEKIINQECIIEGKWVKHKTYGYQFNFDTIKLNNQSIFFFLTKIVSGIGEKLARKLIEYYGEIELERILDENPDTLLTFKGIKHKKLKKIVSSWNKFKQLRKLNDFFSEKNVNISTSLILKIHKYFTEELKKEKYIDEIKENPYILTEIRGIGFKTCDKIALQLGIEKYSQIRIFALLKYIFLKEAENGHTYLLTEQIKEKIIEELDIKNSDEIEKILNIINDIIKHDDFINDNDKYYLAGYYRMEQKILHKCYNLSKQQTKFILSKEDAIKFIESEEKRLGFKLSDKQRKAIYDLITNGYKLYAVCGYAGTGKTTISKIILDFFNLFLPEKDITCCAFTGMASRRVNELTGYQSYTIHSLLKWKGFAFIHNEKNPLPYKVILLDEASMVNLNLFYSLLNAINKDTIFIMVGDNAQLPPIGAGNVFSDLLNYEWLPKVFLTDIFRQSKDSVLVQFANEIREGKVPKGYLGEFKDYEFIKKDINNYFALKKTLTEKELKAKREELYLKIQNEILSIIDNIKSYNKFDTYKTIEKIQIIAPMKKIKYIGTNELNELLQDKLNPNPSIELKKDIYLKVGDKVIHTQNYDMNCISYKNIILIKKELLNKYGREKGNKLFNNLNFIYDLAEENDFIVQKRIFNGNLGMVIHIDKENEFFLVSYPDDEDKQIFVFYSFRDFNELIELGYALTIHKTQGNQFDYIIIPFVNSFFIMLNNKLLYTALTRAKKKAILIGQPYAFKKSCKNKKEILRQTYLSEKVNIIKQA